MLTQWNFLSGDAERDQRNLHILMESIADLFGPRGVDEITRSAVDRAILVTGAQRGLLLLDEGAGLAPKVAREAGSADLPLSERYSRTAVDRVWQGGEAWMTVDAADPHKESLGQSVLELRLLSIMVTPLVVKGRRLGVLYVDSTVIAKEFTRADFDVFNALGGFIALAVDNARLLQEAAEKERMERQLALAHDIQRRLLPADPKPPEGFEVAGIGRPCEEASGDYYDVIPLEDGRVALVVGDVSGHGIGPALYMASARALVHGLMGEGSGPVKVVESVNRFLARDMPENSFMTLFVGVLDPKTRNLSYGSAGHNPPLLVRASGGVDELNCTGPLLSVFEDATYGLSDPIPLHPGDALTLYTDGIYEAHDASGEIYGEDRFRDSLERYVRKGACAEDVVAGVLQDLDAFCADHPLDDDITCLVMRVL